MSKIQLDVVQSTCVRRGIVRTIDSIQNNLKPGPIKNKHITSVLELIHIQRDLFDIEHHINFNILIKKLEDMIHYRQPTVGEMTQCPCCKKDHLKITKVTTDLFFMIDDTHGNIRNCYNLELDRFQTYDGCEE